MKIAIQGREGSYHEEAVHTFFDYTKPQITYLDYFSDVFKSIDNLSVDFGLVALANNRFGFIPEVYRILLEGNYYIHGEVIISIRHQLIGIDRDIDLTDIKEVHSQAPAIGQCQSFLSKHLPHARIVEQCDTAYSARYVSQQNDPSIVAIASEQAANLAGLSILRENIQDDERNLTRFIIIGKNPPLIANADKTSLVLELKNKTGKLADVLKKIKQVDINISLLHSSFIANSDFNMKFFLEIDEGNTETLFQLLRHLKHDLGCNIITLGSYKSS